MLAWRSSARAGAWGALVVLALHAGCRRAEPEGGNAGEGCEAGSCPPVEACVEGTCVLAELPENAFCDAVADVAPADQTAQDTLLALLDDFRARDDARCAGGGPELPALRFDPRLVCAARALAMDLAAGRTRSATDAHGRGTAERMRAAGYVAREWADAFAVDASSPGRALQVIAEDADSCRRLRGAAYRDVGAGSAGNAHVITLGRE